MWGYYKHLRILSSITFRVALKEQILWNWNSESVNIDAILFMSEGIPDTVHKFLTHVWLGPLKKALLWSKDILKNCKNPKYCIHWILWNVLQFLVFRVVHNSVIFRSEHSASTYILRLVKAWNYRCSLGWLLLSEHFSDL